MTQPSIAIKTLVTAAVIFLGVAAALWMWWDYVVNPWTRNGQVMAQVVQITPRVSGTIVELPIVDNQFVKKGDLLFRIDPRTYESTLAGRKGQLAETIDEIDALTAQVEASEAAVRRYENEVKYYQQNVEGKKARVAEFQKQYDRYTRMVPKGAAPEERLELAEADLLAWSAQLEGAQAQLLQAEAALAQAKADLVRDIANRGAEGEANARLRTAKARVHSAELELEFTHVEAPVNGYVTNLNLRLGDHATANHALLALVDVDSYWVSGFFKESAIDNIGVGDRAIVTLMSHPDKPIEGRVVSRGWGVEQEDGSTGEELLPKIHATFEWIRLAQRVPVRVEFDGLPEGVELIVGTTASVLVLSDTAGTESTKPIAAVPQALQ